MTDEEQDRQLREQLGVSTDAMAIQIHDLIRAEKATFFAGAVMVENELKYICAIQMGMWNHYVEDEKGRQGTPAWPTPELAALDGLRAARLLNTPIGNSN